MGMKFCGGVSSRQSMFLKPFHYKNELKSFSNLDRKLIEISGILRKIIKRSCKYHNNGLVL